MSQCIRFDFGNDFVPHDADFIKIERLFLSSKYMWRNELCNRWNSVGRASPYRDIVFGENGAFYIGLPRGEYRIELHFFDPDSAWEPFPVNLRAVLPHAVHPSGTLLACRVVTVQQGETLRLSIECKHPGGVLALCFPQKFFVSGMDLYGAEASKLEAIFPEAPVDTLPSEREVRENGSGDCAAMLKHTCDWLLRHRLPDGFIGDFEEGKRLWYTASYPIRTLLAGYELLHQDEYRDAATVILDLLVSEQMPEGGFTQAYRAQKTEDLTDAELLKIRSENWMNLADVGSMVAALTVACRTAKGARKEQYHRAVTRYLETWALRFRKPEGGFTNGWVLYPDDKIYSVATAASALSFAMFGVMTNNQQYLCIAEETACFLAQHWNKDGRLWNHIYQGTYPGVDHYQEVREFGDGFYTLEAISALLALSSNQGVRKTLFAALKKYLFGARGLLALKGNNAWWPLQNNWHNSKSAGNPILLLDFLQYGAEFGASEEELAEVKEAYQACLLFLTTPSYARLLGVTAEDPKGDYPFAAHSIQCWTGCSAAATGFAGIALAQMLQPGILFRSGQAD